MNEPFRLRDLPGALVGLVLAIGFAMFLLGGVIAVGHGAWVMLFG